MSAFHDEIRRRYGDVEAFVDDLRKKMAFHGISQSKLARRSGYTRANVCRWLTTNKKARVKPQLQAMVDLDAAMEELTA